MDGNRFNRRIRCNVGLFKLVRPTCLPNVPRVFPSMGSQRQWSENPSGLKRQVESSTVVGTPYSKVAILDILRENCQHLIVGTTKTWHRFNH